MDKLRRRQLGIQKAERVLRVWRSSQKWMDTTIYSTGDGGATWAKKMIHTRKMCSGSCCRNPRHEWGEITRQEVRANEDYKNSLRELGEF